MVGIKTIMNAKLRHFLRPLLAVAITVVALGDIDPTPVAAEPTVMQVIPTARDRKTEDGQRDVGPPLPCVNSSLLPDLVGTSQPVTIPMTSKGCIQTISGPESLASAIKERTVIWQIEKGALWCGDVTIDFYPWGSDPVYRLPVMQILDALGFHGNGFLPGKERNVLLLLDLK